MVAVTATGPIRLGPATLYVAPAQVALSVVQGMHHLLVGEPARVPIRSAALAGLPQDLLFTAYSNAAVSGLAQLAVGTTVDRALQLQAMIDFADVTGDLGGLEGTFLSGVRAAQLAGLDDLVERAADVWGGTPLASAIGGGSSAIPVIDVGTGRITLLDRADLVGLGGGGRTGPGGWRAGWSVSGARGRTGVGFGRLGGVFDGSFDIRGGLGGGLDTDSETDYAAKGATIVGTLGMIAGGLAGFAGALLTGPGAPGAAVPAVIVGAARGAAVGATIGATTGGALGLLFGYAKGDAPPPAPADGVPAGPPAPPESGGDGPAPGDDGPGPHSGGNETGPHSGGWHPPIPLPDDGEHSFDDEFGGSRGVFGIPSLLPNGPGLGALVSWQGGNSFLTHALPQVGDDGRVDFGYLGAAGAAAYGVDSSWRAARPGGGAGIADPGPVTVPGSLLDTKTQPVDTAIAAVLDDVARQLLAVARSHRQA